MIVKIPFMNKFFIIADGAKQKHKYEIPNTIYEFLDFLDKEYNNGVWTPDITEITNDFRYILSLNIQQSD